MKRIVAVVLTALCFSACASSSGISRFPRREIDRPFTMPKGVASWRAPTTFGSIRNGPSLIRVPPIPVPLIWESALSDEVGLVWFPLPMGMTFQLFKSNNARAGFSIVNGFTYNSTSGLRVQPTLTYSYRHRPSIFFAIDVVPSFTADFPTKEGSDYRWSSGISAIPTFQIHDTIALKPSASMGVSKGRTPVTPFAPEEPDLRGQTFPTLGFGAALVWSVEKQWDFRPAYYYFRATTKVDLEVHLGTIEFVHYF